MAPASGTVMAKSFSFTELAGQLSQLGCTIGHQYFLPSPAMFTRRFHPDRFLRSVYGTQPFVDYCRQRHIAFEQTLSTSPGAADLQRWSAALSQLSHEEHAQVELELATVNEMAGRDAVAHLIEAAGEQELPGDTIPAGAPLALWFL